MSQSEEEEEGTRGRPNAYFADLDKITAAVGFGGNYRGVPSARGGRQTVTAGDTLGTLDTCWCGEPEGHDWPGKDKGRKHPKEQKVSAVAAEEPHITRRQLPGWEDDVIDIVLRAVNDYGARYRLSKRGIILYPPDKSDAYSISMQTNERGIKAHRRWFVHHCVPIEQAKSFIKDSDVLVDDMDHREKVRPVEPADVAELAKALNSPEHPVVEQTRRRSEAAVAAHARKEAEQVEPAKVTEIRSTESDDEGWEPFFVKHTGVLNPDFLAKGEMARCVHCDWEGQRRAVGGHNIVHDPDKQQKMWGPEAQAKKTQTREVTHLHKAMKNAADLLYASMGLTPGADTEKLKEQLAKVTAERDEYKARLDLLREAMRA